MSKQRKWQRDQKYEVGPDGSLQTTLFWFTTEISKLLDGRLMSAFELQLRDQADPHGYLARKYETLRPWNEGVWVDLCGRMRKLFRRLERKGHFVPTEYWSPETMARIWARDVHAHQVRGEWDDLHTLLCELEGDLFHYSDRWGTYRAYRTQRLWARIVALKESGHELRSLPSDRISNLEHQP